MDRSPSKTITVAGAAGRERDSRWRIRGSHRPDVTRRGQLSARNRRFLRDMNYIPNIPEADTVIGWGKAGRSDGGLRGGGPKPSCKHVAMASSGSGGSSSRCASRSVPRACSTRGSVTRGVEDFGNKGHARDRGEDRSRGSPAGGLHHARPPLPIAGCDAVLACQRQYATVARRRRREHRSSDDTANTVVRDLPPPTHDVPGLGEHQRDRIIAWVLSWCGYVSFLSNRDSVRSLGKTGRPQKRRTRGSFVIACHSRSLGRSGRQLRHR